MLPCHCKVALLPMNIDGKLGNIRKGMLEFIILKIIAADKVYVADMLDRLRATELPHRRARSIPS